MVIMISIYVLCHWRFCSTLRVEPKFKNINQGSCPVIPHRELQIKDLCSDVAKANILIIIGLVQTVPRV